MVPVWKVWEVIAPCWDAGTVAPFDIVGWLGAAIVGIPCEDEGTLTETLAYAGMLAEPAPGTLDWAGVERMPEVLPPILCDAGCAVKLDCPP